ncbi:hypothetical protein VSR01_17380 [Actinacidiphila sp. DG2A-62]|uniref:hypothetical protein n=1 Tax=Actinacidiphila sp. DG2A-62 TaxID=3108821 RepID=UPI002DBF68E3|nr:hypothetical protein [Actinacidiphila sp. DG2A-62]MEC3995211.1 hypothetical protein [Actinacidiphila sp. DG2A-62]
MADELAGGEEEVRRVFDALDGLKAIEDPKVRARAITAFLKEQQPRLRELSRLRREYVQEQRKQKVPRWKIGEDIGVSASTVQDIEHGYSGSGRTRPPKDEATSDATEEVGDE